ncbi:MAG: hypothetical protein IT440_12665 [Phycisphaeraceae bacterium]|nr:hypothetical protein [Phycisphaeraceae bacterium]
MMMSYRRGAALLLMTAWLSACSAYVNIPAQPGDHLARSNPNDAGIDEVVMAAIRAVLDDKPIDGQYQVVLPAGADPLTYAKLLPKLGEDAMWSSDNSTTNLPVLEVTSIRVRTMEAAVDVIRPRVDEMPAEETRQLVTVELRRYIGAGWMANRVLRWRASVPDAQRMSLQTAMPPESPSQGDSGK